MSQYTIKTLGQLVKAQPKEVDYTTLADIIAKAFYDKIEKGQFTLSRSAKFDNNSEYDDNNGSFLLLQLSAEDVEWAEAYPDVLKRFIYNNLDNNKLRDLVLSRMIGIDADKGYLSDITIIKEFQDKDKTKVIAQVDSPVSGIELRANIPFKLAEEEPEEFLAEYENGKNSGGGYIYGNVDKFVYLGGDGNDGE